MAGRRLTLWLFTVLGFVSVVQDRGSPEVLIVRSRDRGTLERLVERHVLRVAGERPAVEHTPRRDYPWRMRLSRSVWRDVLARLEADICYQNFKEEIRRTRDEAYHTVINAVWLAFRALTPRRAR